MLIAKTNDIHGVVPTLNTTSNTIDDLENVTNEQSAYNVNTTNTDDIEFDFGSVSNVKYVGVHGIYSTAKVTMTVEIKVGGVVTQTVDLAYYQNSAVFSFIDSPITGDLSVNFSSTNNKTITYIAAGDATNSFSGIAGGQVYSYLQNNFESSNTLNKNAAPTSHIIRQVAPEVTISINNELFSETFMQDDLFSIYELSNEIGIVSMLDFDSDNYDPKRAWFGFGLSPTSVTADPRLNRLNSISMKFKAGK